MSENPHNYRFKDVNLTPSVIAEIAIEMFAGKVIKRADMLPQILDFHIRQGGSKSEAENTTASLKKALSTLVRDGPTENIGYGQYRFASSPEAKIENSDCDTISPELAIKEENPVSTHFEPQKTIGTGTEMVYAYNYPTYREHAVKNGNSTWPMKIGMSRVGVSRIVEQTGTALPERPEVRIAIMSENSASLERTLHTVLSQANRNVDAARGTEWFRTNEDEIENIVRMINELSAS